MIELMKKIILSVLLAGFAFMGFAYSGKTKATGYIKIYGSEPFTFAGITCDDGRQFSLVIEPDTFSKEQIYDFQGHHVFVEGGIIKAENSPFNSLKDGKLVLKNIEPAEKTIGAKK